MSEGKVLTPERLADIRARERDSSSDTCPMCDDLRALLAHIASLAAEAERLRAELAQAQADARRFVLLIDQLKPDEINHVDLHEAAAQIAADIGPYDAPTDEDYLNAARAAIDSALSNQRGEKA